MPVFSPARPPVSARARRRRPATAARERSGLTVTAIADQVADAYGRPRDDLDALLFAGIVAGARLTAQALADRTGESYIDTLDRVMARLEDGLPLADLTLGDAGTRIAGGIAEQATGADTRADASRPEQHRM